MVRFLGLWDRGSNHKLLQAAAACEVAQLLDAATAGSADCGVAQVHHQRYLLQPTALEVFLSDRSNALLNLPSAEVRVTCSLLAMLTLHHLSLSEKRAREGVSCSTCSVDFSRDSRLGGLALRRASSPLYTPRVACAGAGCCRPVLRCAPLRWAG